MHCIEQLLQDLTRVLTKDGPDSTRWACLRPNEIRTIQTIFEARKGSNDCKICHVACSFFFSFCFILIPFLFVSLLFSFLLVEVFPRQLIPPYRLDQGHA
jgi:hypothetical protein